MGMYRVPSRLLAVALLLVGECSGGLGPAAEAAAHGDFAAPAQHGALPPQVQATATATAAAALLGRAATATSSRRRRAARRQPARAAAARWTAEARAR